MLCVKPFRERVRWGRSVANHVHNLRAYEGMVSPVSPYDVQGKPLAPMDLEVRLRPTQAT